ncbi:MAG: hypothetical protein Kow0010_01280 [Dehalococcoidia bacterium]
MTGNPGRSFDPAIGLCSLCAHARMIVSGRGSVFWLCGLAATDPRFRKYPPLPLRECDGFERAPADATR